MRRLIIILALAFTAISCHRNEPLHVCAHFTVTTASAGTKGFQDDDSKIDKLDLLVFRDSDGRLEARASGDGSSPLEVTVSRGRKMNWYIVANAPDGRIPFCTRESEFLETAILLEDGFVMHSQGKTTFMESGSVITAAMSRYVCKVGIGRISIQWGDALPCRLETVALMNVQGSSPVSGIPADLPLRYNCGAIDTSLDGLLSASPGIEIESSSPVNLGLSFWCMPNPSEGNSYSLPWQPRRTRIALCIHAYGQDNWYPIDLPAMEGNRFYCVDDIVIKGPGASAPDTLPVRVTSTFTVRVLDWAEEDAPAVF